eukprot:evm.model.scf_3291.2 EVM.evm.TU.scf_3291.2   scf_3291:6307-9716(-)
MTGAFEVPSHLAKPTGVWYLDAMPLVTMAPSVATLHLYWRARRYDDLLLYTWGFLVAVAYHICQMHPKGLEAAEFMGVPGVVWRRWDIVSAGTLLARTFGHAIGSHKRITRALPNAIFPAYLVSLMNLFPRIAVRYVTMAGLSTILGTFVLKVAFEGGETLPKFQRTTKLRVPAWFSLGFVSFAMPNSMPALYWFWHSWWHIFLAFGYYELYSELERYRVTRWAADSKKVEEQASQLHAQEAVWRGET